MAEVMIKTIAETAWHHEGDAQYLKELVTEICTKTDVTIVKLHITLDLDEYMAKDHEAYSMLSSWMLSAENWADIIGIIKENGKKLLLLLNDTKAIEFASQYNPEYIELHSVALNVLRLHKKIIECFPASTGLFIGVGGCSLDEVDQAVTSLNKFNPILMFGFQNYPTQYESINLNKIRKIQNLYAGSCFGYADHCNWDEENNELVTLMVAANGMEFVEKHVTINPGVERCDYSAAISIDQFNQLSDKLKVLDSVLSDGNIGLNAGEKKYSVYGPMKMAGLAKRKLNVGDVLTNEDIHYCRTARKSRMSQVDLMNKVGESTVCCIEKNAMFDWSDFNE